MSMKVTRAVLWCLLIVGAGCNSKGSCGNNDNVLNTRKGEKVIAEWLEKQGIATTSVDCPRDIQKGKDVNFLCKAIAENSDELAIDIEITQTNDKGDIAMAHASKVLPAARVERGLAGQISDQTGEKVTVDCGLRVRLAKAGATFTCTVTAERGKYQMQILIKNEDADWEAKRL